MLFNSIDFAIYLPIIFALYWSIDGKMMQLQNLLIVVASYVFYGWWQPEFLLLIILSTIIDYTIGISLGKQDGPFMRRLLLGTSVVVNLGILAYFKYFNFFLDNFVEAFSFFGYNFSGTSLDIILPVGISFYTFQSMSYSIDVFRRKILPTNDFISFSAFVSFFPQLVAGPIERAAHLLPQMNKTRVFDYQMSVDGMRQILWGLFKKIVIADNCAIVANMMFNNTSDYSGSSLLLGALFFSFQIYCDFSGYSDIAIGVSRLFGIDLMQNFNFPYFSRDIAEFWRRWHISLSTWFKDYLYIPLGGSKLGQPTTIRNVFIIFIVSGFWHGANWTFIIWGVLNALYFLPLLFLGKNRNHIDIVAKDRFFPSLIEFFQMLRTFILVTIAWVFFRSESIDHAFQYLSKISSLSLFTIPEFQGKTMALITIILIFIFVLIEWWGREGKYGLSRMETFNSGLLRKAIYLIIGLVIFFLGNFNETTFIYFAF